MFKEFSITQEAFISGGGAFLIGFGFGFGFWLAGKVINHRKS